MQLEDVEHGGELQPVLEQGRGNGDVEGHLLADVAEPSPGGFGRRNDGQALEGGRIDVGQRPLQAPDIDWLSFFGLDVEMHLEAAGLAASGRDDRLQAEIGLSAGHHAPQRDFDAGGIEDIGRGGGLRMLPLAGRMVIGVGSVRLGLRLRSDVPGSSGEIRAESASILLETVALRSSSLAASRSPRSDTSLIAASIERVSRSSSAATRFARLKAR